jgi:hypothetical protein
MIECCVKNCHMPVTSFPLSIRVNYGDYKVIYLDLPLCPDHSDTVAGAINSNFNMLHEAADMISIV